VEISVGDDGNPVASAAFKSSGNRWSRFMPVISTNVAANSALRYLNQNSEAQSSSISKLASGSSIIKASDNAAGLAIGTQLGADVTVLNQAATNASQGSSILQTADGGLARISDILSRLKTLAAQSDSGAVTDDQRSDDIDAEFQELLSEIDDIASSTRYNGDALLDGTSQFASGVSFLVGTNSSDTLTITIDSADTTALSIDSLDVTTQTNAESALDALDTAIDTISAQRATLGATMSRFDYRSETIATQVENSEASQSTVMDVDVAAEKTKLSAEDVKTQAAIAALTQANKMPSELLNLLQS
jgi:flagellin